MKKRALIGGILFLFFLFPFNASALTYSHIVAFGDSLSDGGFWGAPATDDKVWIEYLAEDMGATLDNRAIGGARTTSQLIDFDMQVGAYLAGFKPELDGSSINTVWTGLPSVSDPGTLFSVWIGGNDSTYNVFGGGHSAEFAVESMMASMDLLYDNGARNFLVPNLPDVGSTLLFWETQPLTDFCIDFNNALKASLDEFSVLSGLNLYTLDVFSILNDNWNPSLFWEYDGFHPSSTGHQLIADYAYNEVAPVPEPSTIVLMGLGLVGLAGLGRKKFRK
jgi:phospholipase/lecithinase/hemolysin